jgi:hypothetical protein
MEPYLTILIVISVIAGVYVFGFLVNISFIAIFCRKLDQHKRALNIVLKQKYDAEGKIISLMEKNNIALEDDIKRIYEGIDHDNFQSLDTLNSYKDRTSLSYIKQSLLSAAKEEENFLKNMEYQSNMNIITNCDEQFRYLVAAYNADILGFNYWVRFKPYRYFFLINKVETKNIIQ